MSKVINVNQNLCTGCNRCVRECPMETSNVTYQDADGNIKVILDHEKCITCGRCVAICKHEVRSFEDDTERFFSDLADGVPISLIAAPAIKSNIPDYKKLFTYLKNLGVNKVYDVSLGADICIWGHVRLLERNAASGHLMPLITQPCPTIVRYCEIYRPELLRNLSPVHSPMSCLSIFMKEYEGIIDNIAALSPCISKVNEFADTDLAQYNVTFSRLLEYMEENNIKLPDEESDFDHDMSGIGSLFPMPGGLKENIEFYLGKKFSIDNAEGYNVYERLNIYSASPKELLPHVFDVLNCNEGCNIGTACSKSSNVFEIKRIMDESRNNALNMRDKAYYDAMFMSYDEKLDMNKFMRKYKAILTSFPRITDEDIARAFELLSKDTFEKQNIDCGACGSDSCHKMARKIALNVNIPSNCIVKTAEDAKAEHAENIAIHEADERIRTMLDANPHINILFNSKFQVIDCNLAAVKFMGFKTKEDFLSGIIELLLKGIPERQSNGRPSIPLSERFMTVVKEGAVKFDTDIFLLGTMRNLNVAFKKIPYEDSFAIVAYVFDMTEIHERETELKNAREQNEIQLAKIKTAVKATKIALWEIEIVDGNPVNPNNVFMWSDEFREMLGYTYEEFPDLFGSWIDRVHPDDCNRILDGFVEDLINPGMDTFDHEYWLMKKNGEYAYFHGSGEIMRGEDGNALHVAGTLMDITETKNILMDTERQRIQAEAANQAKSAFLSTMSHEIRTPMNAILGITEIQLQDENLTQGAKEAFDKIYTSGDMLLGIINDILDLSKIEAGKLELLLADYEIASLISDTAQLNMMRIGSKPIEFELEIDDNMPVILHGDELRVKQILNNVLSNAFKYTDKGMVKLSVSVEESERENEIIIIFSVKDTGQGMTKEQVAKLFDEYSRFNMEANRSTEGTGLGMSITRNLIRMMNGEILIDSESGAGSTFTVKLPQGKVGYDILSGEIIENLHKFRTNSHAQMRRVQVTKEYMPYGSVLIVDDVETNIYVARGLMVPYGLRIDSVDSGFKAIDRVKEGNIYDIIFMDHMMPKKDGIETTKEIRELGYEHIIVALTANAVAGQSEFFLSSGFNDFISKPIDVRQLNIILNKHIRDKQSPEVIEAARKKAEALEKEKQTLEASSAAPAVNTEFNDIFIHDAEKSILVLDKLMKKPFSEEGLRTYIINIHGIKSALANIGKIDLSIAARKLEMAGRNNSMETIMKETPAFMEALKAFTEEIKPKNEINGDGEEDRELLNEKLLSIKAACEEYDESAAEAALVDLKGKPWSQASMDLITSISGNLLHSDFDEIIAIINNYIQLNFKTSRF